MSSEEIRKKFLKFFEKRGHAIVPSSSLIPEDPSVLLTTAGMQQFKRYFVGELDPVKDFGSKNTASIQKSFRTSDIDEVGDESHLTFFEMLGNFSFGGYWKKEAIRLAWEFVTEALQIDKERIHVTVHESTPLGRDEESYEIWKEIGISENKIKTGGIEDNFWGPTGNDGPCGPTTEIYIDNVEIWNIVFNEFFSKKSRERSFKEGWELKDLTTKGIDTGMGLERLAMVSKNVPTIFETDLFKPILSLFGDRIPESSKRIVADHIRGVVFLIADGVLPSKKERGSILRSLVRRIISHLLEHQRFEILKQNEPIHQSVTIESVAEMVIEQYGKYEQYKYLLGKKNYILDVINDENKRFREVNTNGRKVFEKIRLEAFSSGIKKISGKDIFDLVTTHGFPLEWIKDLAKEWSLELDLHGFYKEFEKHQEISRAGQERKFGGHGLLLDTGELKAGSGEELKKVTRLHTVTHLLNQALREVLGPEVAQRGSDITTERTRFDFTFPRKMTPEEIEKVEKIVNEKIREDLPVSFKEMPKDEAMRTGALHFFKGKYPERVKIYYVGNDLESAWSKEFCGGPHVSHTGVIGKFKIVKEEASSAGIRRIRATVD